MGFFQGASFLYPILEPFLLQADVVATKYQAVAAQKLAEGQKQAAAKVADMKKAHGQ